jgi:hypothetical protein
MANLELFYKSDECDIYYNADLHIIQSRWKGIYVEGERLREIFNELINALKLRHASIIIADAREMLIITQQDQQWTIDDWYPRAIQAGFRYQGLILSKNTFNELTVKKISNKYDRAIITTQYFQSPSDALDWVREIRNEESSSEPKFNLN